MVINDLLQRIHIKLIEIDTRLESGYLVICISILKTIISIVKVSHNFIPRKSSVFVSVPYNQRPVAALGALNSGPTFILSKTMVACRKTMVNWSLMGN